jgi:hypothetical protein
MNSFSELISTKLGYLQLCSGQLRSGDVFSPMRHPARRKACFVGRGCAGPERNHCPARSFLRRAALPGADATAPLSGRSDRFGLKLRTKIRISGLGKFQTSRSDSRPRSALSFRGASATRRSSKFLRCAAPSLAAVKCRNETARWTRSASTGLLQLLSDQALLFCQMRIKGSRSTAVSQSASGAVFQCRHFCI